MIGMFTMFSAILWYLIDIFKELLNKLKGTGKITLPDLAYDAVVWVIALGGGMLLAMQFNLDAFVLASQLIDGVVEMPDIAPTLTGNIFGGLLLASGSGVINGLLKALGKRQEPPVV